MTHYYAFCSGDILLTSEGNIPTVLPFEPKPWQVVTRLECAVADASSEPDIAVAIRLDSPVIGKEGYQMMGLRTAYNVLTNNEYLLAGKCTELIYWDSNSKYCGVCGSPLKWQTAISKQCPDCGKEWWPSPAVAVIVRISRGDKILMVHARNFRGNFHGLVAGFVELGETLEQAVIREVQEETNIRICNLRYFGSQPWPYPCGLMVGFTADYESGELRLQKSELSGGNWFGRDNLPELPRPASIARWLIEDWIKKE